VLTRSPDRRAGDDSSSLICCFALELGLTPLVEVHNEAETERAKLKASA
jgi:indole-3-glycerol phosphate synthase